MTVFEVVRLKDPKDFRQRRPVAGGKWKWDLSGVVLVPYRLPGLLAADMAQAVFVVEGEKDADKLTALGFIATCNSGGAGKWRDGFSEHFLGRPVIIIPDNDKAGRDHAQQVALSICGKAASVKVLDLPDLPEKGDVSDFFDGGGTAEQLEQLARAAPAWVPKQEAAIHGDGPDPAAADRPVIVITTEQHEVVDQAVSALSKDSRVYQRAHSLVTVRRDTAPGKGFIRPSGSPVIAELPIATLGERLAEAAYWCKLRKTRDGDSEAIPAHPPGWAVAATAARGEWSNIRHLEAVIEAPVMRPDGTIIDTPGYDERTGLLYEPGADFLPVPDAPSLADARKAADELLDLVTDFPFACEPGQKPNRCFDAAAWLAGLLTPLARFAIAGPCPFFLFDANVAGSGKSKLCDLISVITAGRPMARTDYPDENEEMRKCITAIALAGDRLMLLDNIAVPFGGSALDGALTGQTWRGRILGLSKMSPDLPLFTIWYGTGNNVAFKGDAVRRVVQCRLNSPEERPEERSGFKIEGDLLGYALAHRPKLVKAALTVLRAYHVAGRPDQKLTPMDFVAWAGLVRSAVFWASGADPCEGKKRILSSDPKTMERISLINGWAELPGSDTGLTAAEAIQVLRDEAIRQPTAMAPRKYDTLRNVLTEWSRNGELPTTRVIGMRLNAVKGQVIDGKVFASRDAGRGSWAWRVVVQADAMQQRGTSGTNGTDSLSTREIWDDNCKKHLGVSRSNGPVSPASPAPREKREAFEL